MDNINQPPLEHTENVNPVPAQDQTTPPPVSPEVQKKIPYITYILIAIVILIISVMAISIFTNKPAKPQNTDILVPTTRPVEVLPEPTVQLNEDLLPTGSGDMQLDQDINEIDSDIGSSSSDLENVDQGLSDQPVDLTE